MIQSNGQKIKNYALWSELKVCYPEMQQDHGSDDEHLICHKLSPDDDDDDDNNNDHYDDDDDAGDN